MKDIILAKAQAFCSYQERYQQEVRNKLYLWGLWKNEVELIIAELVSTNFINEQRYATTFAGGKFRIKKWGRLKIKAELKKRNIADYCIKIALQEINEVDNAKTINKIISEKAKTIKATDIFTRKHKIAAYLMSRGFESERVWELIEKQN